MNYSNYLHLTGFRHLLFLFICIGCQKMKKDEEPSKDEKEAVELTQEIVSKCLSDLYPEEKVVFDVKDSRKVSYYSQDGRFSVYVTRREYTFKHSFSYPVFYHEGEFKYIDGKWKAVLIHKFEEIRKKG